MSTVDATIMAIDFWLYFSWIAIVIIYNKEWDGVLGYKEKDK